MSIDIEHPHGDISIVTISRDDPAGLARTLASIARQTLKPRDVTLVRAGRSGELAVAPLYADKVYEVADPGHGISAAFNAAIAATRGDWLVFLNGGDAFREPGSLRSLDEARRSASSADIIACRAMTDSGVPIPYFTPHRFCDYLFISHQAAAFRRALFDEIGPYSTRMRIRMDLDWMARYLLARGEQRIAFFDRVIVDYTLRGVSSTSLYDFYHEEFRVLRRSLRFLPALLGLLFRRLPERLLREAARLATGRR